jgi:hypothetical protein
MLLLTGCSVFSEVGADQRRQQLPEAVGKFNEALSWNSFEEAIMLVDPTNAANFAKDMKRFQGKGSITEVNLDAHDLDRDAETAAVISEIKYFAKPSFLIKTVLYSQTWEYKTLRGGWTLVNGAFVEPDEQSPATPSLTAHP